MRNSFAAVALLSVAVMPLSACAGDNGGIFSSGDRVYNPQAVAEGARDGDVIYRDAQGHYYCKREDGTTGTLVGAGIGALLGNIIAPGGSKTVGTILGGAGGALAGRAIDRADLACK
ncbi:MAG TPA: glycine zipper 2TM domain-containing protein [Sphingomonas sp.]|nr:glycine zipper 2TM domain-containing protein [Sphingomonas sp.]